jgi:hypothetical protein
MNILHYIYLIESTVFKITVIFPLLLGSSRLASSIRTLSVRFLPLLAKVLLSKKILQIYISVFMVYSTRIEFYKKITAVDFFSIACLPQQLVFWLRILHALALHRYLYSLVRRAGVLILRP